MEIEIPKPALGGSENTQKKTNTLWLFNM